MSPNPDTNVNPGITPDTDLPRLPRRPHDGHKGTFGTVAVIAGSVASGPRADVRMLGAGVLSAHAALRSGCGLARLVMPEPLLSHALTAAISCTGVALPVDEHAAIIPHAAAQAIDHLTDTCDALVVGPGMGLPRHPHDTAVQALVLRCVQQDRIPVVVDGDGLTALSAIPELSRDLRGAVILTPHPGEFKRLCKGLGLADDLGLARSRTDACTSLAQRLGCVVVLKGHATVVSDGARTWVNATGHVCLATAGTGDVLSGLIAGLLAQYAAPFDEAALLAAKLSRLNPARSADPAASQPAPPPDKPLDLFNAARLAVHAHGLCAQHWAHRANASGGMLAHELLELIPSVLEMVRRPESHPAQS